MAETFKNILIYEDAQARSRSFLPLTYTRSLAELRSGAFTALERARRLYPEATIYLHAAPQLATVIRERYGLPVNEIPASGATALINARDLFAGSRELVIAESLVAGLREAILSGDPVPAGLVPESNGPKAWWEIMHHNPKQITSDVQLLHATGVPRIDPGQLQHVAVMSPESLFIHPSAKIGAMTVFDCALGPILIEEGVEVMPMTTIIGPVVGAFVIVTMQNYLASTGEFVLVIQGVIFVVIVMAFRKGLVGELSDWWKARRKAGRFPRFWPTST